MKVVIVCSAISGLSARNCSGMLMVYIHLVDLVTGNDLGINSVHRKSYGRAVIDVGKGMLLMVRIGLIVLTCSELH